ncbi:methyltransferase domain-containing protein [Janthinobacterium sp. 17J80-10]|uniref:class I SAM-dependent methyltransferase n=1 Tax=Janthinobacterium sp. 17J80-10 TaxID=2497863 RepID=UPI0010057665|nr:methyltransferase domain-containing protein [Janthinobacterium sp. 17J80-10]QAU36099.1 methyltransferase domain-containing protein [Janthinobacterium sp. 17J80-10]
MAAEFPAQPSAWVQRFAPLIAPGEVLDLACGSGRHSRLLAAMGHPVCTLDRDGAALAALAASAPAGIATFQFDLENGTPWPFAPARFAGIVVTNYLHRPLFAAMLASLAPGGVLIYETFARGNERYGKPSNPDFLLRQGELLEVVRNPAMPDWRVVAFEDGYVAAPKPAMVQRICAIAPGASAQALAADFPPIF